MSGRQTLSALQPSQLPDRQIDSGWQARRDYGEYKVMQAELLPQPHPPCYLTKAGRATLERTASGCLVTAQSFCVIISKLQCL